MIDSGKVFFKLHPITNQLPFEQTLQSSHGFASWGRGEFGTLQQSSFQSHRQYSPQSPMSISKCNLRKIPDSDFLRAPRVL